MAVVTIPTRMSSTTPEGQTASPKPLLKVRVRGWFEQWYPWFFGFVVGVVVFYLNPAERTVYGALKGSLGSAVDAAAILAGFQGTALGLLLALLNTAPVKALRRMNLFSRLVNYHWQAILAMLVAMAASMALLAVQGVVTEFGEWSRWIAGGAAFVAVAASLAAFRVTSLMVMILALPNLDAPNTDGAAKH
jgi:hypothetical protein